MTTELKAEEWSEKHWGNPELTRKNLAYQAYIAGATEATKELQEVIKLLYKSLKRQTCETDKNCPLHCPSCDIESVLEKARKVVKELDER